MRVPIYAVIYNVTVTCNYSVSASSWVKRELLQPTPRHSPQPAEQDNPCFLHVHLFESQLSLQLHRMILRSLSGAAGNIVLIRLSLPFTLHQPQSVSILLSSFVLVDKPKSYGTLPLLQFLEGFLLGHLLNLYLLCT